MTAVENRISEFKEQINNILNLALASTKVLLGALAALCTVSVESFMDGDILMGVFSLTLSLLATPTILSLWIGITALIALAGVAQTLFFPVQLLYSFIQDSFSQSDKQNTSPSYIPTMETNRVKKLTEITTEMETSEFEKVNAAAPDDESPSSNQMGL
jgi:hypothetical protein